MIDWALIGQYIGAIAIVGGGIGGAWAAWQTKGTKAWKEVAEARAARNDQLEKTIADRDAAHKLELAERDAAHKLQIDAQQTQITELQTKLAKLEMLPDLSQLLAYLREDRDRDDKRFQDVLEALNHRFDNLEGMAKVEADKMIELMAEIRDRLECKCYAHPPSP